MTIRTTFLASMGAAALMVGSAAFAQGVTAGSTVIGPDGVAVGTIASVDGDTVILKTDRHEVALPSTSFNPTEEGLLFGMTRADVNATVDAQLAEAAAMIQPGRLVHDREGAIVGPIAEVGADYVIVELDAAKIRLPREAVVPSQNGPITGVTVAEIRAQLGAPAPAETTEAMQ